MDRGWGVPTRDSWTPSATESGEESHVETSYDVLNRKTAQIQHKASGDLTTSFDDYDGEGNLLQWTDPKGQVFTAEYDELSRETLRSFPSGVASAYLKPQQLFPNGWHQPRWRGRRRTPVGSH